MRNRRRRMRGAPVAVGPKRRDADPVLAALVAKGGATLGSVKLPGRRKPAVLTPGKSIAEMIAEDRR